MDELRLHQVNINRSIIQVEMIFVPELRRISQLLRRQYTSAFHKLGLVVVLLEGVQALDSVSVAFSRSFIHLVTLGRNDGITVLFQKHRRGFNSSFRVPSISFVRKDPSTTVSACHLVNWPGGVGMKDWADIGSLENDYDRS